MIRILYESPRLVAVDKPDRLATIPERFNPDCLLSRLQDQLGRRLYVVHRLDKDVSGVVLFALDAEMHRYLSGRFESREVQKHYVAVVAGCPEPAEGIVDRPLRPFGSGRMGVDAAGKPSLTRYVVRQAAAGHALLDVYPHTGRRHQIRVHLYSIGHPVAGDPLYGDRREQAAYPRLMLHAHAVAFTAPDGRPVRAASVVPPVFFEMLGVAA